MIKGSVYTAQSNNPIFKHKKHSEMSSEIIPDYSVADFQWKDYLQMKYHFNYIASWHILNSEYYATFSCLKLFSTNIHTWIRIYVHIYPCMSTLPLSFFWTYTHKKFIFRYFFSECYKLKCWFFHNVFLACSPNVLYFSSSDRLTLLCSVTMTRNGTKLTTRNDTEI